jgi:hypothetical protein
MPAKVLTGYLLLKMRGRSFYGRPPRVAPFVVDLTRTTQTLAFRRRGGHEQCEPWTACAHIIAAFAL